MKKILAISIIFLILMISVPIPISEERELRQSNISDKAEDNIPIGFGSRIIVYPLSSIPVIQEKGKSFTIKVNLDEGEVCDWNATLSTAYDLVIDTIPLVINSTTYNTTTGLWHVLVTIPTNTNEELYNLTISGEIDGKKITDTQPRAVSVISEFKQSFKFVHVTDFHIGDPRGMMVNWRETIGWKSAKKCIKEINLIHPDFVVITGDLVFGQLYPFEYSIEYPICYDIIQKFRVPTYLCPGNHDGYIQFGQDGFKFWEKFFGPLYYSFDYGGYHFTSINSYDWIKFDRLGFSYLVFNWGGHIREEQMRWIKEDLESNQAKLNFLMLHHNPLWDTKNDSLFRKGYEGREELLSLIQNYGVDMVLDGHVHYDNITIENNTIFVTTTTCASNLGGEDAYWGYRLIGINNGTIGSYNHKEPKYSIPSYRLNYSYTKNDGSMDTVTATMENDLEMDITGLLRFYVPVGNYSVENGIILLERWNDEIKEIYVEANVTAHSIKEVRVKPAES